MDERSDAPAGGMMTYDAWIDEALRSVVRRALRFIEDHSLLGEHHIYLTFKTSAPGVGIAGYIRAQHPDDMTIVLQHQFSDLTVDEDRIGVTLRFSGKPERLVIPFAAVTGFADPSVNFGLQLKSAVDGANDQGPGESAGEDAGAGAQSGALAGAPAGAQPGGEAETGAKDGQEPGNVVALDAFRKS
ncbi:MAG: SspB family protein [Rhodospirillales bacterium]